jgi:hypothetical protein
VRGRGRKRRSVRRKTRGRIGRFGRILLAASSCLSHPGSYLLALPRSSPSLVVCTVPPPSFFPSDPQLPSHSRRRYLLHVVLSPSPPLALLSLSLYSLTILSRFTPLLLCALSVDAAITSFFHFSFVSRVAADGAIRATSFTVLLVSGSLCSTASRSVESSHDAREGRTTERGRERKWNCFLLECSVCTRL